jgi:hypothetical protein
LWITELDYLNAKRRENACPIRVVRNAIGYFISIGEKNTLNLSTRSDL